MATLRKSDRVVDCGSLENCCACKRTGGSNPSSSASRKRKDGRVVEGVPLERVYAGNRIESSNLSLSAMFITEI